MQQFLLMILWHTLATFYSSDFERFLGDQEGPDLGDLWEDKEAESPVLLEVDSLGVRFGSNVPRLNIILLTGT